MEFVSKVQWFCLVHKLLEDFPCNDFVILLHLLYETYKNIYIYIQYEGSWRPTICKGCPKNKRSPQRITNEWWTYGRSPFWTTKPIGKNEGFFWSPWKKIWVFSNSGTPKWMVSNGKPYWNGWFGGTPIFGNTHIKVINLKMKGIGYSYMTNGVGWIILIFATLDFPLNSLFLTRHIGLVHGGAWRHLTSLQLILS